jgi:hypothetical protein
MNISLHVSHSKCISFKHFSAIHARAIIPHSVINETLRDSFHRTVGKEVEWRENIDFNTDTDPFVAFFAERELRIINLISVGDFLRLFFSRFEKLSPCDLFACNFAVGWQRDGAKIVRNVKTC